MNIGAAALRGGCSVATVRYYEEVGLLGAIKRTDAGRRTYGMPDVARIKLIRRLRTMEFGLDDIRRLLDAIASGSCLDVRDVANDHLAIVRARRAEIDALERTLTALTRDCTSDKCADGPSADCTILDGLERAAS